MKLTASLLAILMGVSVVAADRGQQPRGRKVIQIEIGSGAMKRGGLLDRLLSTADDDDAAAAEEGLVSALRGRPWLQVVTSQGEVAIAVNRSRRTRSSRSQSKDGKRVTIGFRYIVGGVIATAGHRETIEAEASSSHTYAVGRTNMDPTASEDRSSFERAGKELGSKARGWVLSRVASLRPNGPDAGFHHKKKLKWLLKGDGLEVIEVTPSGPADRAGLQLGDRIRRIDSEDGTDEMDERVCTFRLEEAGTRVSLEVERDGARRAVELELAATAARSKGGRAGMPAPPI